MQTSIEADSSSAVPTKDLQTALDGGTSNWTDPGTFAASKYEIQGEGEKGMVRVAVVDRLADANVMAAGLDLLDACIYFERVFGPGIDSFGDGAGHGEIEAISRVRAAIARATGAATAPAAD